jgi:hypothetical protein
MHLSEKVMPTENNEVEVRPFEPWRCARTERARALVQEVARHLEAEEDHRGWRHRARKPEDQRTFEEIIEALVCDLVHLHLSRAPDAPSRLTITRSKRLLASGPPRYRAPVFSEQLLAILDHLHILGHLVQRIGDRSCHAHVFTEEFGETRPRQATTIEPGPVLLGRVVHHGVTFEDFGIDPRGEVVILRRARTDRWDTASPIDYEETPQTKRYRQEMKQLNAGNATADIVVLDLPHIDASDRHLRRGFTYGSFTSGGRLAGGFWPNMPRDLRLSRLRIGGEPVVSLDFSSLNPRLLYARAGVPAPEGDLYAFPGLEQFRPGMKRLLNARLFDRGPRPRKPMRTPEEVRDGVQLYPEHMSVGELLKIIENVHRPIAHYFGTGIGHELQFIESQILVRILLELQGAGVVALGVHDCVLVPRSAVSLARETMAAVTTAETGVVIPVTIDAAEEVGGATTVVSLPSANPPGGAGGLWGA